jgi:16S rRNA (guanine527-N7)-methyltransferase
MNRPRELQTYEELLRRYADSLNLVSRRVLAELPRHIETACAYGEAVPEGETVLDVGSGAGLPGVPLALCRPDLTVVLAERRSKRAAFLDLVVASLGRENLQVYNGDVRNWPGKTAVVTAQGVAPFDKVYRLVREKARYPFTLIARKGPSWEAEAERLGARAFHVKPLDDGTALVALRLEKPA